MRFLKKGLTLVCIALLASCAGQNSASSEGKQTFILKFKPGVSQAAQERVLGDLALKVEKRLEIIDSYVCVHQGDMSAEKLIQKAEAIPEIDYLEIDQTVRIPE